MRLWTNFYKTLQRYGKGLSNAKNYSIVSSDINARLSAYDGYIHPLEVQLFNLSEWMKKLVDTLIDNEEKLETVEGAFELSRMAGDVIHDMWKEYLRLRDNPSPVEKICTSILDQVQFQEDPKNRVVAKLELEPTVIEGTEAKGFFSVYITSNCDGWAEDNHKFMGLTTQSMMPEIGKAKTEAEVIELIDSIDNLVGMLQTLEDTVETVENTDPESEDFGMVFFKHTGYPAVDEVVGYANFHLITNKGGCNWANIKELKNRGYDVYGGEEDSFGWLTGCIENENGHILVYG